MNDTNTGSATFPRRRIVSFGEAVILPDGISGNIDWFSAELTAAAFLALYRFKAGVLAVVLTGGVIGLIRAVVFS